MSKIVIVHSLSENKLTQAIKLGGMPLPSIAAMNPDNEFTRFGNITFIVKPESVNPKDKKNLFFDRDIFSQRIPTLYYDVDKKQFDSFYNKVEQYIKNRHELSTLFSMYDVDSLRRKPSEYIQNRILSDSIIKMMFVDTFDPSYELPYKKAKLESDLSNDTIFKNFMISQRLDIKYDDTFAVEIKSAIERRYSFYKDAVGTTIANDIKHSYENSLFSYDGKINTHSREILNIINDIPTYADNALSVDLELLRKQINSIVENNQHAYKDFVDSLTDGVFKNPHLKNGNRKVEYTLENIEKFMLRQKVTAIEETSDTSIGKISSSYATQFKSYDEMIHSSSILDTIEDRSSAMDVIHREIFNLTEHMMPYFDGSRFFEAQESLSLSLHNIKNHEQFISKLNSNGFNSSEIPMDLIDSGFKIVNKIKNLTNHYFEGKPQKVLNFKDFSAVVLPVNTSPDIIDYLKQHMKVHQYSKPSEKIEIFKKYSFDESPKVIKKIKP